MTTGEHRNLLGILFLVQAGLQLFGGIMAALIYGGMGVFIMSGGRGEDRTAGGVLIVVAFVIGFLILAIALVDFLAGWKLFKSKPGARIWGIVASCISLLGFPLGTALGIYGLWFLFGDAGKNIELEHAENAVNYSAPPPDSWK